MEGDEERACGGADAAPEGERAQAENETPAEEREETWEWHEIEEAMGGATRWEWDEREEEYARAELADEWPDEGVG